MAATAPFARFACFACFALLLAACRADVYQDNVRSLSGRSLPSCAESLTGSASNDVVILDKIKTPPHQNLTNVNSEDHCFLKKMRLAGVLVTACDSLGPPAPDILSLDSLAQVVECHSRDCRAGLDVTITQYCEPV